jgi:hypothetical protein
MFNKAAYDHSDPVKYAVVDYFNRNGCFTLCYEDKKTADIKILFPMNVEVEQRTIWKGETFPYSSISIPHRKLKHKGDNTKFYIVNNELTYAYVIESNLLIDKYLKVKDTTRMDGEKFYHIPIELCKKIFIGNN